MVHHGLFILAKIQIAFLTSWLSVPGPFSGVALKGQL